MRKYWSAVAAIVQKDIRSELRTKEMVASMFVFAVLVLLIFNFTLSLDGETTLALAPGILWVAFVFAGSLGLNRSFRFRTGEPFYPRPHAGSSGSQCDLFWEVDFPTSFSCWSPNFLSCLYSWSSSISTCSRSSSRARSPCSC